MDPAMLIAQISMALITLFWLWMLFDAVVRQTPLASKIIWGLVVIFFYLPGALIYFFAKRTHKPQELYVVCTVLVLSCLGSLPWFFG